MQLGWEPNPAKNLSRSLNAFQLPIWDSVLSLEVTHRINMGIQSQLRDHSQSDFPTEKLAFLAKFGKILPFATSLWLYLLHLIGS